MPAKPAPSLAAEVHPEHGMLEGCMNPLCTDHLACGGYQGFGHDELLENEGLAEGVIDLAQMRPVATSRRVNNKVKVSVRSRTGRHHVDQGGNRIRHEGSRYQPPLDAQQGVLAARESQ